MNIMKKNMKIILILLLLLTSIMSFYSVMGQVDPETVELTLFDGQSFGPIVKTMTTSAYPPRLDFLLLEDETGSFGDDITNMQAGGLASDIWEGLAAEGLCSRRLGAIW